MLLSSAKPGYRLYSSHDIQYVYIPLPYCARRSSNQQIMAYASSKLLQIPS